MSESTCPCGSGKSYADCCEKIIRGEPAENPEMLMRARYSAYVKGEIDFIMDSMKSSPQDNRDRDREEIRRWSQNSQWEGLEIIRTENGGPEDDSGIVEFIARYRDRNIPMEHHEIAEFRKEDGKWIFFDGELVPQAPYVRKEAKVGRNDPCPCGSGKKYKKCCGK